MNPIPRRTLRLGFVPLTDCAPVVMAQELGLFRKFGLDVVLSRELGWATIRDKVIYGELDAAHALAAMPFATTLGLGSPRCDCVTGLVLNLHGNAITLSNDLWKSGVTDGAGLRGFISAVRRDRTLTLGVVHQFSSHHFLLRAWLTRHGIDPDRDVRIVVVPPPQMTANLRAGNIDGFCVGEPWNSVAVREKAGWIVETSAELDPGHPEKVLMVRSAFATERAKDHETLIAALMEACAYCDNPANRNHVVTTLARPEYVNAPVAALRTGMSGEFDLGHGRSRRCRDFAIYHRDGANEPLASRAAWVANHLRALLPNPAALTPAFSRRIFRDDIFSRASVLRPSTRIAPEHETSDTLLATR